MLARHAWSAPPAETLLLTYSAKKRSEVAPGVGAATDMIMFGPQLGTFNYVGDHVIAALEEMYQRRVKAEQSLDLSQRAEVKKYVEELATQQAKEEKPQSAEGIEDKPKENQSDNGDKAQ